MAFVSSLILLVIVAAWAVVLVPMLLNRHESASEIRSVDRFASAMRVLARRTASSGDGRYVVVPRRPERSPSVVVNGTSRWVEESDDDRRRLPAGSSPESSPELPAESPADVLVGGHDVASARATVAARRLRVMLVLAAGASGLVPLAVFVSTPLWAGQAGCDALLMLYVFHLRGAAPRARCGRAGGAARARFAAAAAASVPAYARAAPPPAHLVTPPNALVIERQEDGSWIPVPVPVPTYVNAALGPPAPAASDERAKRSTVGLTTEEDLDRRLEAMERRLAVND